MGTHLAFSKPRGAVIRFAPPRRWYIQWPYQVEAVAAARSSMTSAMDAVLAKPPEAERITVEGWNYNR
jgi:hypothetical protein